MVIIRIENCWKRPVVVDTNVILRFLLADHPDHFRQAAALMADVREGKARAYVPESDRSVGLQMPQLLQRIHRVGEDREHRAGRDRIEQIADVVVARGPGHREQAPGIAATLRHLQVALGIQERRALGEEDRERPHGAIRHGILHIIAGAFIRKSLNDRAKERHKAIEGRWTVV